MTFENIPSLAVITGGSNGIGKAISQKLASENTIVVVADIVPPETDSENIKFRQCDITIGSEVDALFEWVLENFGTADFLVLNAGKGIHEQLIEGDPEKWAKVIDLNVMGALRIIRAFLPSMLEKKAGNVIFISSVSAQKAYAYGAVYGASKAALEMIAETLRLETLPHIKVTVVEAGVTDTNFFKNQISSDHTKEDIGMGSLSAEDIAEDVWYAINKNGSSSINKIVARPSGQSF